MAEPTTPAPITTARVALSIPCTLRSRTDRTSGGAAGDELHDGADAGVTRAFDHLAQQLDGVDELHAGQFVTQHVDRHRHLGHRRTARAAADLVGRVRLEQQHATGAQRPHDAAVFGGHPPINFATNGTQDGLMTVRRFLDAARGGAYMAPNALDAAFDAYDDSEIVFS